MIRSVETKDAKAIADIYNYYVKNTFITFEEDEVSEDEMKRRIKSHSLDLPWIVYEKEGCIYGYAYASKWSLRSAYRYSVESTIYLNHEKIGKGLGVKLYRQLLDILVKSGIRVVVGVIALPNEASVKLHEKLGFVKAGRVKKIGYKFEKWIDVGYWQLQIG